MRRETGKSRCGVSLIELMVAVGLSALLLLIIGVLLVSGQRAWHHTYNSAHKKIKQDAQAVMLMFGSMGRRSNRLQYRIYDVEGSSFVPVVAQTTNSDEVVSGSAVEFRYWDVELDESDSYDLLDVGTLATAYVLFYVDGDRLMVDSGPYPPGAVPPGGGPRNTSDVTTIVLAENVTTDSYIGAFSHSPNSEGQGGCVRINIILTDPNDGDSIKVMTATLMRNIWPR